MSNESPSEAPSTPPLTQDQESLIQRLAPLRTTWWAFLLMGLVLTLIGVIALGSTAFFSFVTAVFFGVLALVGGIVEIGSAISSRSRENFLLDLLLGVFYVILGVVMIRHPIVTLHAVTLLLGVFALIGGVFRIAAAFSLQFSNWGWTVVSGALSLLLGAIILGGMPWTSVWVVGLFVGIEFLFSGINWIMVALALRSLPAPGEETPPSESPPTTTV